MEGWKDGLLHIREGGGPCHVPTYVLVFEGHPKLLRPLFHTDSFNADTFCC